jgi:hypothetical protein
VLANKENVEKQELLNDNGIWILCFAGRHAGKETAKNGYRE